MLIRAYAYRSLQKQWIATRDTQTINSLNNSYRKISPKHYRHPGSIKIFQIAKTIERRQWTPAQKGTNFYFFFQKKVWFFAKAFVRQQSVRRPSVGNVF